MRTRIPDWSLEVIRFAVTGAGGLVANITVLLMLVEIGGMPARYAAIFSTLLVLAGGFVATDRWVFPRPDAVGESYRTAARSAGYYVVMLLGKGLNYGVYLILLGFGLWYPLAWLLGSIVVFAGTFSVNRFLWRAVYTSK